jgi:hypothetical protein
MKRLKATWERSEVEEVRYIYTYIYVFSYMGLDMSLDMGWMGSFEFGGGGGLYRSRALERFLVWEKLRASKH